MPFESHLISVLKTLAIGTSLMLVLGLAGCFSTRAKDADDAEAAAARSQAAAERAEAAADKALEASAAAMKEADKAAEAVRDATKEMDRVSAHLEQLQREREEQEEDDAPVKPRRHKTAVAAEKNASSEHTTSESGRWGNATAPAAASSPAAKPSPAP